MDPGGARGFSAAGPGATANVEGDGEPQLAGRGWRPELPGLDHGLAAAAGDVVPDRAARGGDPWSRSSSRPRYRSEGAAQCSAGRTQRGPLHPAANACRDLPARLPGGDVAGRRFVGHSHTGQGGGLMTAIAFRPVRAKFVRITADRERERRTAVDRAAVAPVSGACEGSRGGDAVSAWANDHR
jgi:hypothetical protein